jgi:hypothetical protein
MVVVTEGENATDFFLCLCNCLKNKIEKNFLTIVLPFSAAETSFITRRARTPRGGTLLLSLEVRLELEICLSARGEN